MTAISFEEAAIRGDLHINRVKELADLGYFKTTQTPLNGFRVDQDSYDQYLANQKPIAQVQKEMIIKKKEELKMSERAPMPNGKSVDKIGKFGWGIKGKFGEPRDIPKELLKVDLSYQRPPTQKKIYEIQSHFNRVAFGRVIVSERADGSLYTIDGWHRVRAAMSRSDMAKIPCDVYHFDSIEEEAQAFIDCNINRKPVQIIHKFHAGLISGDKDSQYIERVLRDNEIQIRKSLKTPRSFKSIGLCYKMAKSPDDFESTIGLVSELCEIDPIHERLVGGIFYLSQHLTGAGITEHRLRKRILALGPVKLLHAANEASYEFAAGGNRIWALGMLKLINKGLKITYKLHGENA